MSPVRPAAVQQTHSALPTVRRLVVFLLLFALVLVGASGLAGLLDRLLAAGAALAANDVGGLARSLAFAVVGGSLAAILWWIVWRRLGEEAERASLGWGLYVAGIYGVALITSAAALLGMGAQLVAGGSAQWRPSLAIGIVWAGVWAWHRWMWLHPGKGPRRLNGVPTVVGSVFGLILGTGGTITALGGLLDAALQVLAVAPSLGRPWWVSVVQSLVWAAGGCLVWWWHWIPGGGRFLSSGLANVAVAVFGVLGGCILALSGTVTALFVLLRLVFDRDPASRLLDPLGPALAAAAIGSLLWTYHAALADGRSGQMRQAVRLLASGAALVAAASGIGVIVNAALGLAETTLAGTDTRTLLLGGISALAIGGPVWWRVWNPTGHPDGAGPDRAGADSAGAEDRPESGAPPSGKGAGGRRIYLVAIFGLSAVVALVTLLVIGYQAFEYLLDGANRGSLAGRVRAPLGLLVATGLVAGYHYGAWRRERAALPPGAPPPRRTIGHVILVTGSDPAPLSRVISDAGGARITVWKRADGGLTGSGRPNQPDLGLLAQALEGVSGERVLVVIGPDARIDVVPLAGGE
ncbi:DUF5671 domain-containing protein [Arthrobacter sp. ZGTC131]|uniref:DUF5671 domain-containing protein n=1 Tax=Arthrobacter sp. ZGTC131 TaxID=2058898 RepID=UPI000CE52F91|nr:DUF5671 domain-containing protein [Arthrobacter sp. ZGTC131]